MIIPLCFFFEQAEKELNELSFHVDGLNERLDEADGLTSAQVSHYLSVRSPTNGPNNAHFVTPDRSLSQSPECFAAVPPIVGSGVTSTLTLNSNRSPTLVP